MPGRSPRCSRVPCAASMATISARSRHGRRQGSARRRCSSSSARTRPSASSSSTGLPAGRSRSPVAGASSSRVSWRSSATSATAPGSSASPDSSWAESGEALDPAFKKIAAAEIEEFKRDWAIRSPGRSAEEITDEDLLREVMNTIGKPGRLGEQVRCVVSVSMLTEGWDATTVTHILGVRAFGTQLLCEQVVGRGLRRTTYVTDENDMFPAEYAEVYGVPFSFIPVGSPPTTPVPLKKATRVRALPERVAHELTFPRLTGYRSELAGA